MEACIERYRAELEQEGTRPACFTDAQFGVLGISVDDWWCDHELRFDGKPIGVPECEP